MIKIPVYLADPAGLIATGAFGAGAKIRIERSANGGSTWAELTTIDIDTTTTQPFVAWDQAGTTATLYRWRISDTGDTFRSEYSEPAGGIPVVGTATGPTYANLGDLLARFQTPPTPKTYTRLQELLVAATDELTEEMDGRDYFRHPASGTATWYAKGDGTQVLHVHDGIISLTTLEVSIDRGLSYIDVPSDEYVLEGRIPGSDAPGRDGEPSFHVRLLAPFATVLGFPVGAASARLTGARGWAAWPNVLREGVAQRARQMAYADPSLNGAIPGPPQYESGTPYERWPQTLWRFMEAEAQRFSCWN